jgi:hypothetical protein
VKGQLRLAASKDYTGPVPFRECGFIEIEGGEIMNNTTREKYLKYALVVVGILFLLIYPMGVIWPSGWVWHGGEGMYYLQMICGVYAVLGIYLIFAAENPAANRSLISFTIWSSVVHAAIMAVQALTDSHEHGHLIGDVPGLLVIAAVLWFLSPKGERFVEVVR